MTSLNYVEPPNNNLVWFFHYNHRSCTDLRVDLLHLPVSATTCNDNGGLAQSQIHLDVPQRSVYEPNNHKVVYAHVLSRVRFGGSETFTALSD